MYRFKQLILLGGDLIAFFCAFLLSLSLRHLDIPDIEKVTSNLSLFFFVFLLWIVINYINGLYDLKLIHAEDRYKRIFGVRRLCCIETPYQELSSSIGGVIDERLAQMDGS